MSPQVSPDRCELSQQPQHLLRLGDLRSENPLITQPGVMTKASQPGTQRGVDLRPARTASVMFGARIGATMNS